MPKVSFFTIIGGESMFVLIFAIFSSIDVLEIWGSMNCFNFFEEDKLFSWILLLS